MKRCGCPEGEIEQVPGHPQCLRCIKCGGWFTMRVSSLDELDEVMRLVGNEPQVPASRNKDDKD